MTTAVDLSRLPAPKSVEELDVLAVRDRLLADYAGQLPAVAAELALESEPAVKLSEVFATHELFIRQRINDAFKARLIAFATGSDLDHVVAFANVERLVVTPADPAATPPVAEVLEEDDALRLRYQLSFDALSTCGTINGYRFFALSADGRINDVAVINPQLGEIHLAYYATDENDNPVTGLDGAIVAACDADTRRPLSDIVTAGPAQVVPFDVTANLIVGAGADPELIRQEAIAKLQERLADVRFVGRSVPQLALSSAVFVAGVRDVEMTSPAEDVGVAEDQIALPGTITVTVEVAT